MPTAPLFPAAPWRADPRTRRQLGALFTLLPRTRAAGARGGEDPAQERNPQAGRDSGSRLAAIALLSSGRRLSIFPVDTIHLRAKPAVPRSDDVLGPTARVCCTRLGHLPHRTSREPRRTAALAVPRGTSRGERTPMKPRGRIAATTRRALVISAATWAGERAPPSTRGSRAPDKSGGYHHS